MNLQSLPSLVSLERGFSLPLSLRQTSSSTQFPVYPSYANSFALRLKGLRPSQNQETGHGQKTGEDQDRKLRHCVLCVPRTAVNTSRHRVSQAVGEKARSSGASTILTHRGNCSRGYLTAGVAAHDLVIAKDFFRSYIATSHPQLTYVPNANAVNAVAGQVFLSDSLASLERAHTLATDSPRLPKCDRIQYTQACLRRGFASMRSS